MIRHPAWWLLLAWVSGAAWALDPPRPAPAPAEVPPAAPATEEGTKEASPPAEDATPAPGEGDEGEVLPPAPGAATIGPTPQRFDPSEKVRADFPVSFPIDI